MNKKNTKSNKEIYREFSRSESSLAVFHKDWWLVEMGEDRLKTYQNEGV